MCNELCNAGLGGFSQVVESQGVTSLTHKTRYPTRLDLLLQLVKLIQQEVVSQLASEIVSALHATHLGLCQVVANRTNFLVQSINTSLAHFVLSLVVNSVRKPCQLLLVNRMKRKSIPLHQNMDDVHLETPQSTDPMYPHRHHKLVCRMVRQRKPHQYSLV